MTARFGAGSAAARHQAHLGIYVSGSSVVSTLVEFEADQHACISRMRADRVTQLDAVQGAIAEQVADLAVVPEQTVCNLVLAPEMYSLALLERPAVDDEELVDAVRWLLQDQVDFSVETALLDVFELPRAAARDRRMVYAAALPADFVGAIVEKVRAARLNVASVDITELALRNLSYYCFPEADQNVGLLRLTANNGLINISRGDELFLTRRVKGVPEVFDEEHWDAFREALLLQVQRSIDYYESAMGQPHCDILIVTCTHGWAETVTDYLNQMLTVPARSIEDVLAGEMTMTLHNPNAEALDWAHMRAEQINAVAAGLPALGGALRNRVQAQFESLHAAAQPADDPAAGPADGSTLGEAV